MINLTKWRMMCIGIAGLLAINMVNAQNTGKISGIITDAQTGEPLIGANVILLGSSLGSATDLDGNYFILNVPVGKYNVQASMVGYEKIVMQNVIVNSSRTTKADFKLKSTALMQEAVTIEAIRPDVERDKTSTSVVIRTEDVQSLAGMRNVSDVIGLAADVMDGHFRGGRSNEEYYSLQGMGLNNPLDNSRSIVPIMSAVEEVEVITSGFGAQYGNAQSGVVNITMKEGKSDKWRSFGEVRMRTPSRKHFGPSVYDYNANTYLQAYSDTAVWGKYLVQTLPHPNVYNDRELKVALARLSWLMSRRQMNQMYGNEIDYSVEMSAGGPINENMRMFVAFSNNTTNPTYPVEHPDITYQAMGNIVTDLGNNATLRISGAYARSKTNDMPSEDDLGEHRNRLWNLIAGVGTGTRSNLQVGLRFTQAISQRTFLELKVNMLGLEKRSGGGVYIPDSLLNSAALNSTMGNWFIKLNVPDDGFEEGNSGGGSVTTENSKTYSLDASITSQVTKSHLLSAGIQANFYQLDIDRWKDRSLTTDYRKPYFAGFHARPSEASIYIQDKMEFQGMIANIGLRMDVWDQNRYYQNDPFVNQQRDSGMVKTSVIGKLQPRVGISFPVSEATVFHLNYGSFMQRPSFNYMFQYDPSSLTSNGNGTFGNPSLKPMVTYSYDVGVTQSLGEGFTFDASGYYRNIMNQIEEADYFHSYTYSSEGVLIKGPTYTTYINRDYADVRGFRLQLSKRRGNLTGDINYQFSVATGKSSAPGNAKPIIGIDEENTKNVPKKDILLNFDRTHNLIINAGYRTDENWGFKFADSYPLGNISLSVSAFARSGRPYTYNPTVRASGGATAQMNMRMPAEYNTNIKLTKRIKNFFGTSAAIYIEVFNLFDSKRLNYDYITGLDGTYFDDYHKKAIDAPDGIMFDDSVIKHNLTERGYDHSFILYENEPRSITFGMAIEF